MAPAGTQETICRIVEEYSDMLLRLACTRLDSTQDAEDAVQEVFLSLLTSKPVFRDAGHEKAWLIRATLHRASDIRRRAEKRNVPLETAENSPAREEGGELRAAATVNFMTQKMIVEFDEGQEPGAVMQNVLKACKKVEPDCEIAL